MTTQAMAQAAESRHFELVVTGSAADAELQTAMRIRLFVSSRTQAVLGLATGRTMLPVYRWLRKWHSLGDLSFAHCVSFNLDEYCGLPAGHPSSFAAYMRDNLFAHVDMAEGNWHLPFAAGASGTAAGYDALIREAGGIGLQLLGLGRNGHIGFNEPGSDRNSRTRKVALTQSTRETNAADFPAGEETPTHAVTMGLATILEARRILLLATGAQKADALGRACRGPVDSACPASFLQMHDHVTVICDRAAGAQLGEIS